eukprot:CAMPEP_0114511724 /NCGR_PEP_ID=MMETSP0109-20121206/14570_1 /TAXON_ID=29199 /ORGANISM="Chlorarachnion reptans, Strain CCCM449" /LENGTH=293 /DNA_ID=CAMNT_0001691311 /DNA_START=36 /DNA_END=917 /DNA_ORIENTATION=+
MQNDFMESYSVPSSRKPNYDISSHVTDGVISAGSLAVRNSSQIVDPINKWIDYFEKAGGKIFASLDWHLDFCRNGSCDSNPDGCKPHGGVCGPLPMIGFNSTGKCIDDVAVADFERGALMQWPDHCVMKTFGSRFQPFLNLPNETVVVKKGWYIRKDTYSAFGGTRSKESYPFDTEDTKDDLKTRAKLVDLLTDYNITRFWTVGLALDFCVGGTILDSLGKNKETKRGKPPTIKQSILVLPCTRAVSPTTTGAEYIRKIVEAGGIVANQTDPPAALKEICSNVASTLSLQTFT